MTSLNEIKEIHTKIQKKISEISVDEMNYDTSEKSTRDYKTNALIQSEITNLPDHQKARLEKEFFGWGPIEELLADETVSEILINGPKAIWYEQRGQLYQHQDFFLSDLSFQTFIHRLSLDCGKELSYENPFVECKFGNFRLTMISANITQSDINISIRKHPENPWTFDKLMEKGWCDRNQRNILNNILKAHSNFLIVGPTGCGKTSVINSFFQSLKENERAVLIEDTDEIKLPNSVSTKLLTRTDPQNINPEIDQTQLLKRALRLRPDRIVLGEIRGGEAKDFLMALATGHKGSFGTLHANNAAQAMVRLEMLIQMGAPQWNLQAIRKLIQMSLEYIIVLDRNSNGERKLNGVYRISSLEDFGFLLEQVEN